MSRVDDGVGLGEDAVGRLLVAGLPGRAREVVGLAGLSSRISGASGSSALRALTTAGSGSYSTSISGSASRAEYSSVAITNATSWPWKRTLSPASTACVS